MNTALLEMITESRPVERVSAAKRYQALTEFRPLLINVTESNSSTPSAAVSEPTFGIAADKFGTLDHVEPAQDLFHNSRRGLLDLRDLLLRKADATAKSLLDRVLDHLEKYLSAAELEKLLGEFHVTQSGKRVFQRPTFTRTLVTPGDLLMVDGQKVTADGKDVKHNGHSALFGASAVLTDDIRSIEALRHALTALRRIQQRRLGEKQLALAELQARIPVERVKLDNLDRFRIEKLEDYLVAQRLLADHWREVEAAWAERKRVIENHLGLYFVRVRETPLSRTLPDPLDLRQASADDLVPGCANRDTPLAEDLVPFMDAVLDLPLSDWAALAPLAHLLPGRARLPVLVAARRNRLALRYAAPPPAGRLGGIARLNQNLARELSARPFTAVALADMQRQAAEMLSLEDLLHTANPVLRGTAQALHQKLDAAAGCVLARLRTITPSLRAQWADLAEDDRLAVETPEAWPGLSRAADADFNGVRTLVELAAWWFRQLAPQASGSARAALRNFLRATLMVAAGDNPDDILQGRFKTLPGRFRVGEPLRLELNREPRPGAVLQISDAGQRVIGTVRIEDHDAQGTVAVIASVLDPLAQITQALRVSGRLT